MSVTQVGTAAALSTSGTGNRTTSSPVTGSWGTGQNRTAPNLLVACVTATGTTSCAATAQNTGTSGWTKLTEVGAGTKALTAVWTKVATGSDAAPAFTSTISGTATMSVTLFELTGEGTSPLDVFGTVSSTGSISAVSVTTNTAVSVAGEFAIGVMAHERGTAATRTIAASGTGYSLVTNDGTISSTGHVGTVINSSPTSGSTTTGGITVSGTVSSSADAGVLVVFGFTDPGALSATTTATATFGGADTSQVIEDAVGPSSSGASTLSGVSLSWTHVIGASANYIIAVTTTSSGVWNSSDSMTCGSHAMTLLAHIYSNSAGGSTSGYVSIWGLANPPTGSQTMTFSPVNGLAPLIGGSVSYKNVVSVGTPVTGSSNGTVTSFSVSVPSTTVNGRVVAGACTGNSMSSPTQTSRWLDNVDSLTASDNGAQQDAASTGGTVTLGWSIPGTDEYGVVAVELLPASGTTTDNGALAVKSIAVDTFGATATHVGAFTPTAGTTVALSGTATHFATLSPVTKTVATFSGARTEFGALSPTAKAVLTLQGTTTHVAAFTPSMKALATFSATTTHVGALSAHATSVATFNGTATHKASLSAAITTVATFTGRVTRSGSLSPVTKAVFVAAGSTAKQGSLNASAKAVLALGPLATHFGAYTPHIAAVATFTGKRTAFGQLSLGSRTTLVLSGRLTISGQLRMLTGTTVRLSELLQHSAFWIPTVRTTLVLSGSVTEHGFFGPSALTQVSFSESRVAESILAMFVATQMTLRGTSRTKLPPTASVIAAVLGLPSRIVVSFGPPSAISGVTTKSRITTANPASAIADDSTPKSRVT